MIEDDIVQTVHAYIHCLNSGEIAKLMALFSDEPTVEDPIGSIPRMGREEVSAFYRVAMAKGIEAKLTGDIRLNGNTAAFPFEVILGARVLQVIDVMTFDELARIRTMSAYWGPSNETLRADGDDR